MNRNLIDPTSCSRCGNPKPQACVGWAYMGRDGPSWLFCPDCLELHRRTQDHNERQDRGRLAR